MCFVAQVGRVWILCFSIDYLLEGLAANLSSGRFFRPFYREGDFGLPSTRFGCSRFYGVRWNFVSRVTFLMRSAKIFRGLQVGF